MWLKVKEKTSQYKETLISHLRAEDTIIPPYFLLSWLPPCHLAQQK